MEIIVAALVTAIGGIIIALLQRNNTSLRREMNVPDTDRTLGETVKGLDNRVTVLSSAFLASMSQQFEGMTELKQRTDNGEDLGEVLKDIVARRIENPFE